MARSRRHSYRSSLLPALMIGGTAIGLVGLAGLLVAWSVGFFASDPQRQVDRTGQLAFPALSRPVSAFESIGREHLTNPNTGQLNVVWLPEATAEVASRDLGDLMGRVLRRDKVAGMVLTESDFLPKGTKPGVSAGIPPGKFAVTIPTSEIPGLDQLRHGDRFDLMVALNVSEGDRDSGGNTEPAAVFGGIKPPSLRVGQLSRQHGIERLVTGAQLVALSHGTQQSTKGSSGLTARPSGNRGGGTTVVTYAEIAIDQEEIGPLTEAISLKTPMTCIIRSGHPEAEVAENFSREGLVPVITTATEVTAFSELTDQALIDGATGQLHYYYFPPERVPDHWLTDPTEVYGRVASRSLRRGSPITDADLLPTGTKPGISAGVPPGMVAMAIMTSQISGFADLRQGDRFAIHAKVPESVQRPMGSSWVRLQGGSLSPETARFEKMLSTGIREVVPEAIYLRNSADSTATIAVPEERVAEVAQLIRDKTELFVVARSSEQVDEPGEVQAGVEPLSGHNLRKRAKPATPTLADVTLVAMQTANGENEVDDQVQVPILTRDVDAFESLAVDDFIDPATGEIRYVYFPKGRIADDWAIDVNKLIDRVAVRSLKAGRTVSNDDLAPPGAVAGPSAGVPPGMKAVLVDSAQIEDLDLLRPGTEFSIVSGRAIQVDQLGDRIRRTVSSADAVSEADKLPGIGIPLSRSIVSNAIFLISFDSVERRMNLVLTDRTEKRATIAGGIETVAVEERPRFETDTQTVQRFAIAVPEYQAESLISFLDRKVPLRVSIKRFESDQDSSAEQDSMMKQGTHASSSSLSGNRATRISTFVREHFYGSEDPFTEVFVSDRNYPTSYLPVETPTEYGSMSHE